MAMMSKTSKKAWVGFDLGGTKMLAVVYNDRFKALGRARQKSQGVAGAKAGLGRVVETIRLALADAKIKNTQLGGIGIAVPGPVNGHDGTVIEMPNLGWKNMKLAAELRKVFKCPVSVLNDVDAGTYGEYRFGAGRGGRTVLGIFPGTGIGGGCVYRGEIFSGASRSCMEIGHINVQPQGAFCGCGSRGCLEAVASRLAISQAVAAAAYRGDAPFILKAAGTNLKDIRSGLLAQAVAKRERAVVRILEDAARWIGMGAATLINLLNPDIIVLGGGLVTAIPGLFLKGVRDGANATCMKSFRNTARILIAELGDDATVKGAAAWAMHATPPAQRDATPKNRLPR
ncbi:MAG: ROK family protein [Kiritimatiellaeota bacterium]|nr:ROK family protein [Kiritimatiellota bacterium]